MTSRCIESPLRLPVCQISWLCYGEVLGATGEVLGVIVEVLCIIGEVLGVIEEVLGVTGEVLGVIVEVLGVIGEVLGDADLAENVSTTEESSVCRLVHEDKVRYPSATLASEAAGQPAPVYGEHYLFP
ncbi:hypothetical protein AVEN_171212-1 [Araneus ventricosus]|uniref:Uncharacterized protein n=1 Tax=Araneus ventricosus TaxID=182803 RepID=A0A4Y2HH79_ARAVE|nr:hypothetical protein AVEN_171212-1 [Araneus ventricosus]